MSNSAWWDDILAQNAPEGAETRLVRVGDEPPLPLPQAEGMEGLGAFAAGSAITVTTPTNFADFGDNFLGIEGGSANQFYVMLDSSTAWIRYDISGSTAAPTTLAISVPDNALARVGPRGGSEQPGSAVFWVGFDGRAGGAISRYLTTTGQNVGQATSVRATYAVTPSTVTFTATRMYVLRTNRTSIRVFTPNTVNVGSNRLTEHTAITLTSGAGTQSLSRMKLLNDGTRIWVTGLSSNRQTAYCYAYTISGGARDSANDITYTNAANPIKAITSDHTNIYFIHDDNTIQSYGLQLAPSVPTTSITATNGATNFDTLAAGRFPISSDTAGQFYVARVVSSTVRPFIRYDISDTTATPTILSSQSAPTGGNWGGAVQNAQQFWLGRTSQNGATALYNRTTGQFINWNTGQSGQGALITLAIANDIFYILDSTSAPTTIKGYTASGAVWTRASANDITLTSGAGTVAMQRMRLLTAGTHIFVAGLNTARTEATLYAYTISTRSRDADADITYRNTSNPIKAMVTDGTSIYFILDDNNIQRYTPVTSAPVWDEATITRNWTIGTANNLNLNDLVSHVDVSLPTDDIVIKSGTTLPMWISLGADKIITGTPTSILTGASATVTEDLTRVTPDPADGPTWNAKVNVAQGNATGGQVALMRFSVNQGAIEQRDKIAHSAAASRDFYVRIWGDPLVPTISAGFVNEDSATGSLTTGRITASIFWIHIDFDRLLTAVEEMDFCPSDITWTGTGGLRAETTSLQKRPGDRSDHWAAQITIRIIGSGSLTASIAEGAIGGATSSNAASAAATREYDDVRILGSLTPGPTVRLGDMTRAYSDPAANDVITLTEINRANFITKRDTFYIRAEWMEVVSGFDDADVSVDTSGLTGATGVATITNEIWTGATTGEDYVIKVVLTNTQRSTNHISGNVKIVSRGGAIGPTPSGAPTRAGSDRAESQPFDIILQGDGPVVSRDTSERITYPADGLIIPIIWDVAVDINNAQLRNAQGNPIIVVESATNAVRPSANVSVEQDPNDMSSRKWLLKVPLVSGSGNDTLTITINRGLIPETNTAMPSEYARFALDEHHYLAPAGLQGGWAKITPLAQVIDCTDQQDAFEIEFSDDVEVEAGAGGVVAAENWKEWLKLEGVPIPDDAIEVVEMDNVLEVHTHDLPRSNYVFAPGETYTFGISFSPDLDRSDPTTMDFTTTGNVRVTCVVLAGHRRFYTVSIVFPRIGVNNTSLRNMAQTATVALNASNFNALTSDVELLNTKYGGPDGQNLVIDNKPSSVKRGSCETLFIDARPAVMGDVPSASALNIVGGTLMGTLTDVSDRSRPRKRFRFVVGINANEPRTKLVIMAVPGEWSNIDIAQLALLDIPIVD